MTVDQAMEHAEQPPEREPAPLGDLLAAIGNHEPKALLLAAMRDGFEYTGGELNDLITEIQGDPIVWRPGERTGFGYCIRSLGPSGLVDQMVEPNHDITTFRKTTFGRQQGNALAGHLLDLSWRHPQVSLREIFGATNTRSSDRESRAPIRRSLILMELLAQELPCRQADLQASLNLSQDHVSTHLESLNRAGLIDYVSHKGDRHFVEYNVPPDFSIKIRAVHQRPALTQEVAETLIGRAGSKTSAEHIANVIKRQLPKRRHASLERSVGGILSQLAKRGDLELASFSGTRRSAALFTPTGRTIAGELADIIGNFVSGNEEFLRMGRQKAAEIVANPETARQLIAKAMSKSPHVNGVPAEKALEAMRTLLSGSEVLTTNDIEHRLADDGIVLSHQRVLQHLRALERANEITGSRVGREKHWVRLDDQE